MKHVIIIGGGHAGIEATLAVARMGVKASMITLDIDHIGAMSCNPSIGGPAKGVVVREIDALGGEMARATDATYLQMKILNTGKGPGVQCLRAQSDKIAYAKFMQQTLKTTKNVNLVQVMATSLIIENGICKGVGLEDGTKLLADAVILTTGTYLRGKILIGHDSKIAGPDNQRSAYGITDDLVKLGFKMLRLKTGTPPRIYKDSVDYSRMELQPGNEEKQGFSYKTKSFKKIADQHLCYLIHTTPETHKLINDNLGESAMYGGKVEGTGPRYCPSIEDKIVKFADKEKHQLFIEPESVDLDTIYLQGFSTSMPIDIQEKMIRTLPGLENCRVKKYAYAIEYDAIDPTQLKNNLEAKTVANLFFAGQINGTSGYEEAAGQGLIAGINAVNKVNGIDPLVLRRDEAYIGVMIDDLVTKGVTEPYRLLTSRAEYRLLLRHDNADLRLSKYGSKLGLVNKADYADLLEKQKQIFDLESIFRNTKFGAKSPINDYLKSKEFVPIINGITAADLLKRPELNISDVLPFVIPNQKYDNLVLFEVEVNIKYEGYIKKQLSEVEDYIKLETYKIPATLNYLTIDNLAIEARQKLDKIKPTTIGQASRISGVNPSDIGVLLMTLKAKGR
jgi:tRNA uridine 5-carboxymethylaminomethyl modification enzyme